MSKQLFTKEYEDFLITGSEESIQSLPSGSLEKEYFLLIRQILKGDLTSILEEKLKDFIPKIPKGQSYRLGALYLFKMLQKNPEKKGEIIQAIKNTFDIDNVTNYEKPVKYNKTSNAEKEENESQK